MANVERRLPGRPDEGSHMDSRPFRGFPVRADWFDEPGSDYDWGPNFNYVDGSGVPIEDAASQSSV